MQVYKFGGASVKDAEGVRNLARILKLNQPGQLLIVISAMGKTTNLLEALCNAYFSENGEATTLLQQAKDYHEHILHELFPDHKHPVYDLIANTFVEIEWILEEEPQDEFDYLYDQIVSVGELLSTRIVSTYLNSLGYINQWLDARNYISTDNNYRDAKVDWPKTENNIQADLPSMLTESTVITQGFIGSTSENFTTTLGREGSDFTAAIFASCLNAEAVTIWKDVPGVLNADPKWFDQTELIKELSYLDAIELTYYGATVIHPKTIKPLQNKNIPLIVRSFLKPETIGTVVHQNQGTLPIPSFIFKVNQVHIAILPKDFSFIVEDNLSHIFTLFHQHKVKINMMHNSAVSFSVSVDDDETKIPLLVTSLKERYDVSVEAGLELVTIRYYNQETINRVLIHKEIVLEVKNGYTCQMLIRTIG
ncbi:aspartate kinase [bacterium A37T11]|nr:aspartate kinase [bacterium A37T11]